MYTIALNNYFINDVRKEYKKCSKREKEVMRHIDFDDYFGTLATVIDLARQNSYKALKEIQRLEKENEELFNNLRSDLFFLEQNYWISRKNGDKKYRY